MSRRITDSRGERALGVFLDKYFYERAQAKRLLTYERVFKKEMQVRGVDVILGESDMVDEKAQLYYINKPLNTFAFEIDYFDENAERVRDGWFINPSNLTTDYLLLWIPEARTQQLNRIVSDDFEVIEADLLKKSRLKAYLAGFGISDKMLKDKAIKMRKTDTGRINLNDNCHLVFSRKGFSEKPINLVVDRVVLDELSESRFEITKTGFKSV